jgi:hypothetical protein
VGFGDGGGEGQTAATEVPSNHSFPEKALKI